MTAAPDIAARPMTEKQFQDAIVELAERLGWLVYHTYDSRRSNPGWPDLVMVRDGRMVVAELKVGKNRLTSPQGRWIGELREVGRERGIEVAVWREDAWPERIGRVLRGEERAT